MIAHREPRRRPQVRIAGHLVGRHLVGWRLGIPVLVLGLLMVAGCDAQGTPDNPVGGLATVGTNSSDLGKTLVDAKGRTLYLFEKDDSGESYCTGACAAIWPPYTSSGAPRARGGASAGLLGRTTRKDGTEQVTYHGHPLYYYVADNSKPGSLKGQDIEEFGAAWYVVSSKGEKAEAEGGAS